MSTEQKSGLGQNVISLPKGGGAIAGMGESFSPDLFTGTGNFSVPIAVPPGRNGLQPSLTLAYSTGSGNGAFGLGWNLSLPGVARKTNLGIPRYDDTKDVFVLSGAEDLIPVDRGASSTALGVTGPGVTHRWVQYRPRTEGLFARIVHHTFSDGRDFWEVRTKDGMVTWYGNPDAQALDNTVLYDPENPRHIAQWMIHRTADPFGNEVVYEYERDIELSPYPLAQLYLKRVKYVDFVHEEEKRYLCSVALSYTDRPDPHSEYRQGFEIRTRRRCTAIDTYTHPLDADMPEGHTPSGTDNNTVHVKRYALTYRDEPRLRPDGTATGEAGHNALNKVSQLAQVQAIGYNFSTALEVTEERLPPVEFEYTDVDITQRNLMPVAGDHLPALGLGHPEMDLVDLNGNGLPDLVQMSAGQPIRYWSNTGGGTFARPRTMRTSPLGLSLQDPGVNLMDADGDGRVDLVVNSANLSGYYSLNHDGEWDQDSFRPYATRPPLNLKSEQAQFMDLSGDGRTDVLVNGNRFECYFQNSPLLELAQEPLGLQAERRALGWSEARFVNKPQGEEWPNVNFGDPRIRTADMSGDGLQDIVQVQDGNISYWPNLGYGRFGKRRLMRNGPRIGHGFDPSRLMLGDADGDGLTDVIYVEQNSITLWINQSGNGFSDPITIKGTPSTAPGVTTRMVDLLGTGTPGILWSYDLGAANAPLGARMLYLDLCGGVKPYVMVGMRNNLGARTRVQYRSSVEHWLRDAYKRPIPSEGWIASSQSLLAMTEHDAMDDFIGYAGKWKTTLPFPVQVVDRVEVFDEISKGKLTTRYFYHHGYWDGGEREFRGFGRVDQFDTETFERYNDPSTALGVTGNGAFAGAQQVSVEHYAPPVLARNWFHLGPVGAERGDWGEVDFADEYWSGDTNMLHRDPAMVTMLQRLPRRARRDAYRTLRGTALRSELYSMDGSALAHRPYTVSETQTGLRLVDSPKTNATIAALAVQTHSNHIFFSFGLASRSTTWERGNDPMTKFSFTGDIDAYGQPLSQVSVAVPRGKDPRTGGELAGHTGVYDAARGYDATVQYSTYVQVDTVDPVDGSGAYMVNRVCQARSYEAENDGSMSAFALCDDLLKPRAEWSLATPRLLALSYTYYDGTAFEGDSYGVLGDYGVPVRTETLMVRPDELTAAYGGDLPPCFSEGTTPDWSAYHGDWVSVLQAEGCGYTWHDAGGDEDYEEGYYTSAQRSKFDFHDDPGTAKGLPVQMMDVYENTATVTYDGYGLLPVQVQDTLHLSTSAAYDYRTLQAHRVSDPNNNVSLFAFTPLGLMHKTALRGKDDDTEGDTLDDPGVLLEYDLFAFVNDGAPVWVKTTQRIHHINADYIGDLDPEEQDATIVAVEYSDGFGRQLQTRTQAEDLLFGDALHGDSGLPADQDAANADAVGVLRDELDPLNVVVSGAKLYNNKGKVVEQWEPYFGSGFDLVDTGGQGEQPGQRVRIYYDALGRPQRTLNPDGTEQRVVYGVPNALNTPDAFAPSPWERYSYDANDLAPITHPMDTTVPEAHHWTPKSEVVDALGRTVRTTEHLAHYDAGLDEHQDVVMKYAYDIQGRLLEVKDPMDRICFAHKYDTAGNNLWTEHLDSGVKTLAVDAQGKALYSTDAKGALVMTAYDGLHRPTDVWARDNDGERETLRQHMVYGETHGDPLTNNMNGRLWQQYDEAGYVEMNAYDFKGNPLEKMRQVVSDDQLTGQGRYVIDWTGLDTNLLDTKEYVTTLHYDGLNRVRMSVYPEDVDAQRKELVPTYNRAGALESITFDGVAHVRHIAYNAKGQRILLARENEVMTRYTYDAFTFRLLRIKSEKYTTSGNDYVPTSGTKRQDSAYVYDLGGNIITIKERKTGCGINGTTLGVDALDREFEYDPLKRLLQATGRESNTTPGKPWSEPGPPGTPNANNVRAYTQSYSYDKVGNLQVLGHVATGGLSYNRHYRYTTGLNLLEQLDDDGAPPDVYSSFTYDSVGNQITCNTERFYEWDAADQLKYFKISAGGSISIEAHYLYAGGTRLKKFVRDQQGNAEVTVYIDGVYEHRYTKDSGGTVTEEQTQLHVMDGRSSIATLRLGDAMGETVDDVYYTLEDHLGTSSTRLNTSGTEIDHEEYYPFGDSSLRTWEKKRYRYVGKEKDGESGLYYYGARYYMAWVGRFVSIDPLAPRYAHLTPYNYAGNKPIGDLDVDGMQGTNESKTITTEPTATGFNQIYDHVTANGNGGHVRMQINTTAELVDGVYQIKQIAEGIVSDSTGQITQMQVKHRAFEAAAGTLHLDNPEGGFADPSVIGGGAQGGLDAAAPTPPSVIPDWAAIKPDYDYDIGRDGWKSNEDILDGAQTAIGLIGLLPGFGDIADLADAAISIYRGDYLGAGISILAAIPIVGSIAALAIKQARKAAKTAKALPAQTVPLPEFVDDFATMRKVEGRGSTINPSKGTYAPRNLREQLAVEEAMANPGAGTVLSRITMTDPRWPSNEGWVKMQQIITSGGSPVNVHYVRNLRTGAIDDFKIKE